MSQDLPIAALQRLSSASTRREACGELAVWLGADDLLLLTRDPEHDVYLPAPGLVQTLPQPIAWRRFLKRIASEGSGTARLNFPRGNDTRDAYGLLLSDGSVAVLFGGSPDLPRLLSIQPLLPLVTATVSQERIAAIAAAESRAARSALAGASQLASALDGVRRELHAAIDRSERQLTNLRRTETALRVSEYERDLALRAARMGTWRWSAQAGRAAWSETQEMLFGLERGSYDGSEEMFLAAIHPDDRRRVQDAVKISLSERSDYRMEYRVIWPNGSTHWLIAQASVILTPDGSIDAITGVTWDVTDWKTAEAELIRQAQELARSNADLQEFAYVTSHDLQEPLRQVISYAQFLQRRYGGQFDADADQFLEYIVSGARRMRSLIQDLLAYSRVVNVESVPLGPVDLNEVLQWALGNLQMIVEETGAVVRSAELPVVTGNQVQLVQLMQNLISNAVKYRRDGEAPVIDVRSRETDDAWEITVADNGTGIAPQYQKQIFGLFRRLRGDVPGTGIGLTLCKNIVERHGGRIWVESTPGAGSSFCFTIPRSTSPAVVASAAAKELP